MKRALWYLWDTYISTNLATIGVIAVLSLAAAQWLRIEFIATYYYMLPMMLVIFVAVFSFNLTTIYRNLALSMNCRRADFFRASQVAFLAVSIGGTAICWLAGALPRLLGLEYAFQEEGTFMNGAPVFVRPAAALFLLAVALFLQPIGAAMGGLYGRSKVWGTICVVVVMILGMAGTVVMLFVGDGSLVIPPVIIGVFLGVLAAICAGCEVFFWRTNGRAVVQ